jgi:hypothetical protein
MLVDAVKTRLRDRVPGLHHIHGALALAALMAPGALAQTQTPAAFVVPGGERGAHPQDVSGGFIQEVTEAVSVILVFRGADAHTDRSADLVDELRLAVRAAIAGWAPATSIGVFRLVSGQRIATPTGSFGYALDFALSDQLRII